MNCKKYIIGNWKLHKDLNEINKFFVSFKKHFVKSNDIVVGFAPTNVCLQYAQSAKKIQSIEIVAQDVSSQIEGSYTGQVSAKQLHSLKLNYAIIGHSETREFLGCNDVEVGKKVIACYENNVKPIICIGEKASQKRNPQKALKQQLETIFKHVKPEQASTCLIAYEPIWAIGTGEVPSLNRIKETVTFIKETIKTLFNGIVANNVAILYGGSVNVDNALDIMKQKNVDGLLIGGASLDPTKINKIIKDVNVWARKK